MLRHWRQSRLFKIAALSSGVLQLLFPPLAIATERAQIVTDGRTATSLSINGAVTDIRTNTISGRTGLNSFSRFNVYAGNTVNLHLPDATDSLVNMVHDEISTIDGYLNAYRDGRIGGDVYFLNPYGVMVGESGVLNAARVILATPTPGFMNQILAGNQMASAPHVAKVLDNDMPLSRSGVIDVRGNVNALADVRIEGGSVALSGAVRAGTSGRIQIEQLVNLGGDQMVSLPEASTDVPDITITSQTDIVLAGDVIADGTDNQDAGAISITADGDIFANDGANITASGQGINSDGGRVYVMADNLARLGQGAMLRADGGTNGDGGFVEFSARQTVDLAGGYLSANALNGVSGTVLIDPANINVSTNILRTSDASGTSLSGLTWSAGSLTLQADDNITVADNVVISSRRVTNATSASAHRNDSSTGASGNITLEAQNISLGNNSLITAKGNSGQTGGIVTLDADSSSSASITANGAELAGAQVILDVDAVKNPTSNYDALSSSVSATINLTNTEIDDATDNVSITANALQGRPSITGGLVVNTDIRRAISDITLDGTVIVIEGDITIASQSDIKTDMSNDGWQQLGTLAPLSIGVATTQSQSSVTLVGATEMDTLGDVSVTSTANTLSTIYTQANTLGAAVVGAISITENNALLEIGDTTSIVTDGDITVLSKGKTNVSAIADASAGQVGQASGAIAFGVGLAEDNTSTIISDYASIESVDGNLLVGADSQMQTVFAARAGGDDNFTATAQGKFDAAIDDIDGLDQSFMGVNMASALKSGVADGITSLTTNLGGGSGGVQLAGALTYTDIENNTETRVETTDPSNNNNNLTLTADDNLTIRSRAITQTQSFASGRTDDELNFGAAAGIAIQQAENRNIARVSGANGSESQLAADYLKIQALTEAYEDNVSDMNRYNVYAASGVGSGSEDSAGIAGAVAINIVNINESKATVGDGSYLNIDNDTDIKASNITEAKIKADGSKNAIEASGRFMATLKNETPADQVISTKKSRGKLGIGASVAVNVIENTANAIVEDGARFSNTLDNLSISALQTGTTESEARSAGDGGVAIVPLAAVTVARNNALAEMQDNDTALTLAGSLDISSDQTVRTTAVGNGVANSSGQDTKVAVGISAGIAVSFDSNTARLARNISASGDVAVAANTSHDVQSGAEASSEVKSAELIEDAPEPEEPDNASNNDPGAAVNGMLGMGNGFSGKTVNVDVIKDKMNTDTGNVSGGNTPLGGGGNGSDSKSVAIAGALGVSYVETTATAEIVANTEVTADDISVTSLKNTDVMAVGDASTAGSDYNIGGGLGLSITTNENRASVRSGADLNSDDLTVEAGMLSQLVDNETDITNSITASSTSGAGTGELAIAGALGVNVVLSNDTIAEVEAGADLDNVSGATRIAATATNSYDADAKATVGKTLGLFAGIDAALSGLQDFTVWSEHLTTQFTNLLQSTANTAFEESSTVSSDDSDGGSGGGDDEGGVGIGAGIALNIVIRDKVSAEIADNVSFSESMDNLSVAATSTTEMNNAAFAGAKPGAGSDPAAKTSLDAAVSVGVLVKEVEARVGSGTSTLNLTNDAAIAATSNTISTSTAKGEVSADETAVGASVAVGVALEDVDAGLYRSVTSTAGGLDVTATGSSQDIVLADAVAAGTVLDKYTNKLGVSKSDLLNKDSTPAQSNETPDSMKALDGDFSDGNKASFDLTGDSTNADGMGGDNKKSGSINIAASVAVSWADHDIAATIGDGVSISTAQDVNVKAINDVNYRTRGSGIAVFADNAIGVGVGILATSQNSYARVGANSSITSSSGGITVSTATSENHGTDSDNKSFLGYASAEGIAGAGGGDIGVAGSLALVYSDDEQTSSIGASTSLSADDNVSVSSIAKNKVVSRAWAIALASDATCKDPGNCNSNSSNRTAVGAGIAVNVILDNNSVNVGEGASIAGDNVTIEARDLSPKETAFNLDPEDNETNTSDYLTANYTSVLQNSSYYAEGIAGAGAQDGNAIGGSLAFTLSLGRTQAQIGEGVNIAAVNDVSLTAYNESDVRHLAGAVALSSNKKAVGASLSGIYMREDVQLLIANDGTSDDNLSSSIRAGGDINMRAEANQSTLTFMAAGGVSTNDLALAGTLAVNVLDSDVEAIINEDALIETTGGAVQLEADSFTKIRNFALAVAGSGGSNSVGGSLAVNLFLTDKKALVGAADNADNNISVNAAGAVNIGVDTKQNITNGVISASVSTSSNAISGALSANVIKGDSYALIQQGADINDNATLNALSAANNQSVDVHVKDNTTLFDLTGTLAASSSNSVGVALAGNVIWKDVKAGINGIVNADNNVMLNAETVQNLTATTVGIAGSTGGFSGAGSISVGLIKSTTFADVGSSADIQTDGSVGVQAIDNTDIFMLEPAVSFSAGGSALAGAVGAAVFLGKTKARVLGNANIEAKGQTAMQVAIDRTDTNSPLLDGIFGGGDNETRNALGDFNDNFTFDNIKDLFLTETRRTEERRGVAVTAVSDQDVISIAASGAVSSDNAIAISLSAGVGINETEASIANGATINNDLTGAHANQDVTVKAISDMYWVDLSAALGIGAGTAGVGVGADIVVQVKDTTAKIDQGAVVKANRDVLVNADSKDRIINSAATVGVGSTAGVAGTASVGVIINNTEARVDGDVQANRNATIDAESDSELIQIAGAVGGGGTAGIGASFGIAVVNGTTLAEIGNTGQVDAVETTSVTADATENSVAAVLAGGIGGTVGVSVSAGIKVHDSTTKALIRGGVNQRFDNSSYSTQDVLVRATNSITTIDVIGGIGGGGTVGVGVSLNALVVHNKAQAGIYGLVSARRNVDVEATSAKSTKNFTLAGAAGGTVSVAGNVAVILVGAQADEETDSQMTGEGDSNLADDADDRNNSVRLGNIIADNKSDGDYSRTGSGYSEVAATIDNTTDTYNSNMSAGARFNNRDNTSSLNQTKAFIASSAVVNAGDNLTVQAEDTTNTIFTAGAIGGAGVVGVGVTVGVLLVNNTAEAYIGEGARANAGENLLVKARTAEDVNSGALSAGGAGITSVQGAVMTQVTTSKTRAYIADNATVNADDNSSADQDVAVLAQSDTSLLSVTGSGGGALVGVGITGDSVVLDKETKAYIGDGASVASGGDIKVDAKAETDIIQVALSINGGLVGVTGSAGIIVAKNDTRARIGDEAVIYARDSVRLESIDDIEVDGIVIAGAGGAVGVSGAFGIYVLKSVNKAEIGEDATITALAQGAGLDAADGTVDNSSLSYRIEQTRDQDGNETTDNFTVVNTTVNQNATSGVSIAAVTNEDINLAPVGLGFGAVGVAGVVSVTTSSSTTEALVGTGTSINGDTSGVDSDQDLKLLASSKTLLNNIASGISAGAAAVSLTSDTQVFNKTVRARMLGDNVSATRNMSVKAMTDDTILQTTASLAVGGEGQGGIVGVSVVNNTLTAEIGDNATVRVGNDLDVLTEGDIHMIQSAGNVAGGATGGIGASLGVLVAKSTNTARIGSGADVAVRRNLNVRANANTQINQNIIGFSGGMGLALTGSIGLNILKTSTIAEIGANARINQLDAYNDNAAQSVSVVANDNVTTQGAAGAAAVGGAAGIGIGLVATVSRNTVRATIGDGTWLNAQDDVTVSADSSKDFHNTGIAFGGGVGLGAAGSVALTLVGGSMSDNASDTLSNDNGDMVADAASQSAKDRSEYETDNDSANAKSNTAAYTSDDDAESNQLVMNQTAGLNDDIRGSGADSTRAEIGANVIMTADGDVTVRATETLELAQISGGAAIGSVGVGGFVAVADYAGSVTARIGDNTIIDNVTSLDVAATVQSGDDIVIELPSDNITVKGVNSTVIGASVGLVGISASIAQVNLAENARAELGDNVSVTTNTDTGTMNITADRDVDAEVNVAAVAAGIAAAGVSYAGVNASGGATVAIGNDSQLGTNNSRFGNSLIRARNGSTQKARGVSAGLGYAGAVVGAVVKMDDAGTSQVAIGDDTGIYANGSLQIASEDRARNTSEAVGVAVAAGIGLSIISSNVNVDRNAYTDIGANATLVGDGLSVSSLIGESGQNMAKSDVVGAGGGLLVGATGSESLITNDADTRVRFGDNATVKSNRRSGSNDVAGGTLVLNATNLSTARNESSAIAVGAVAIGAHVVRTTQSGGARIEFGQDATVTSLQNLTMTALSDRDTRNVAIAGAGGLAAINAAEGTINHTSDAKITFEDGTSTSNGADIDATDNITLTARNTDSFDGSIDAGAVALAGATGAKLRANGSSATEIDFGNYARIDAHNLTATSDNSLEKSGLDKNFKFDGGGAISVTVGDSRATQAQTNRMDVGENSLVTMRGTGAAQGSINLTASLDATANDEMVLNTGALVGVPVSDTAITSTASNGIYIGEDSFLKTTRGDVNITSNVTSNLESNAKTSVWGLAGIGATGKSKTTMTANNTIDFGDGSTVRGNGRVNILTNDDVTDHMSVKAITNIYNNTLIAGIFGEKADATLNYTNNININDNARIQSASDLAIKASDGVRTVSGRGFKEWLQYVGIAVIPLTGEFGSGSGAATNDITLDGQIETGVYNHQYLAFGRNFGTFIQDPDNASGVTRRGLSKLGSQWVYTDNNTVARLDVDNLTNDTSISVKSHDFLTWDFDQDASFSNDIQAQMDNLSAAKAATVDANAATLLSNRIAGLDNQTTYYQAQDDGCETVQCLINQAQDEIDRLTGLINDNTTPAGDIPGLESQRTDAQNAKATFEDPDYEFVPPPDYTQILADIASEKSTLQAELDALSDDGDATVVSQVDAEIAFLEAMRNQMNTGQVDVIDVGDIWATSGNVILQADTLKGASTGNIESKNEVSVTIRNNSSSPLRVGNIEIPNSPAGQIVYNTQLVENSADIVRYNKDKSASVGFGMTSDSSDMVSTITISSEFDPNVSAYNPGGVDIKAPELILAGTLENRRGAVKIDNLHGSIFNNASIIASEVSLTSGGAFFVNDKTPGIYNIGPHPSTAGGFLNTASNARIDGIGSATDNDVGGCIGNEVYLDVNNNVSCNQATANQQSESSYSIAGDVVYIMANTVNVNGLIQSGIADKSITIGSSYDAFTNNNGVDTYALELDNISMTGSGNNREGVDGVYAYYDAGDDVVEVSGLEAKGGEVTIVGKVISTGKGQINVLDGYGTFNITNNSSKTLRLAGIKNTEVEGKVTFVDNTYDDGSANAMPRITQYTRIGDDIRVFNNDGTGLSVPTASVSGLDNTSGRITTYTPRDGMRYYWIEGEQVTLNRKFETARHTRKTPGVTWVNSSDFRPPSSDFEGATIPTSKLPSADFAARQPSVSDDYRFRLVDTTQQVYSNTYEKPGSRNCRNYLFVEVCDFTVVTDTIDNGSLFYIQDVAADRPINVKFIGSDRGTINVTSVGNVELSNLDAKGSNVSITSSGGNIVNATSTVTISADNISFDADGSVGLASAPITLIQDNMSKINIDSGNGVYMETEVGNLDIERLVNTGGNIILSAGQDLTLNTGTNALVGDNISLTANFGAVADQSGNAIRTNLLDNTSGALSVYSRKGNVALVETSGDLRVGQININGNLDINVPSGDLLDGNTEQVDDTQTQTALLSLWTDLGLLGAEAETKKQNQISKYEDSMTQLYVDYWNLRNVEASGGSYTADPYDPNFSYDASADEEAMLNNDAGRIANYEAEKQARYQLGHEKFGTTSYSSSYAYSASDDEIDEFSAGYAWNEDYLEAPLPSESFKEITDTTAFIEAPNILADNITLTVSSGNIGTFSDVDNFTLQAISEGTLDNASKIKLAAAESDDVDHDPLTDIITLTQREDLDIETLFENSVVTINAPSGYGFLGGESDLNIDTLAVAGEVRLKVNGDILNVRTDNNTVLSATDAVIESGAGQVGAEDKPFIISLADGYKLTARGANGIWITEESGDINVSQIYSPEVIELTSPGRILDAQEDSIMDIKGDNVTLRAVGSIGAQPGSSDNISVKKGKALDVASVNYDNSSFVVLSDTDGAWLYGPLGQSLRMTGADVDGLLDVAVGSNLKASGSFETNGNDVIFRSYESLQLDGDGGVDTNGALLNLLSGQNMSLAGEITTGGGNIYARATDNMTILAGADIRTENGNLTIDMNNLLNQNVSVEDTAVVNVGTGITYINASGTVTLTGLTSSNDNDCLPNQQGCSVMVLANRIQDGGNTNPDITMNSNGDIRLNMHEYANLTKIDYNGSEPLNIYLQGKNEMARAVGSMLGIDAEAGINVQRLIANSAAFDAPLTDSFNIIQGRIRDNAYISAGEFDARVGRLDSNSLTPDAWLLSQNDAGYFSNGALLTGEREEDYRCTGAPSYITNAGAVLDFNLTYSNPSIDCSGVLTYYRLPYVLTNFVETSEQILDNQLSNILRNSRQRVRLNAQQSPSSDLELIVESGNQATQALMIDRNRPTVDTAAVPADNIVSGFRLRETNIFGGIGVNEGEFVLPTLLGLAPAETPIAPLPNQEAEGDQAPDTQQEAEADSAAPVAANDNADDENTEEEANNADENTLEPLAGEAVEIGPVSLLTAN
ncbi:MAG: leukotoxin LktA family filamentous adhesin [Candidatus Puniceispirillaceae bacterium]